MEFSRVLLWGFEEEIFILERAIKEDKKKKRNIYINEISKIGVPADSSGFELTQACLQLLSTRYNNNNITD